MIREKKKNVASSTPNANLPKTMDPSTGSSTVEKKEKGRDVEYEVTYVGTPHQVGTTWMNPQMLSLLLIAQFFQGKSTVLRNF